MSDKSFYGWKLLAAFWVILFINLAFSAYGSSVINAYMVADLMLDRRTLGLMVSVYMMMSGLRRPLVAMFVNRYGVRATLVCGSGVLMLGALGMATFVNTGIEAVIVFGFVVGLGVVSGGAPAAQIGTAILCIAGTVMLLLVRLPHRSQVEPVTKELQYEGRVPHAKA